MTKFDIPIQGQIDRPQRELGFSYHSILPHAPAVSTGVCWHLIR